MTEKTMTDADFDDAVRHVTSFYQSKRAKVKKQITHWIGKFRIVKAENHTLRKKIHYRDGVIEHHRAQEAQNAILTGQLKTQVDGLQANAASALKEWDKKDVEIRGLKLRIKELESGVLV